VSEKVKSKTHLEGVMRGAESKKRPVSLELSLRRTIGSSIRRSGPSFNANVDSILDEVGKVEHTNSRCLPRLDSSLILAYYHFILKEVGFDPSLMKSISASKIKSAQSNRFAKRRVQSVKVGSQVVFSKRLVLEGVCRRFHHSTRGSQSRDLKNNKYKRRLKGMRQKFVKETKRKRVLHIVHKRSL